MVPQATPAGAGRLSLVGLWRAGWMLLVAAREFRWPAGAERQQRMVVLDWHAGALPTTGRCDVRTSSAMTTENALRSVQQAQVSLDATQSEVSTGKQLRLPSDDPATFARVSRLRENLSTVEQYDRNAEHATLQLRSVDAALLEVSELLGAAKESMVAAASTAGQGADGARQQELLSIRDQLASVANRTVNGEALFGGVAGGPAVVEDGGGSWELAAAPSEQRQVRLSDGGAVVVSVDPQLVFTADGSVTLFALLSDAAAAAADGDRAALSAALTDLEEARARLNVGFAEIGAADTRVAAAQDSASEQRLLLLEQISLLEDTDLAEAVTQLRQQELVYELALQSLARTVPMALTGVLR